MDNWKVNLKRDWWIWLICILIFYLFVVSLCSTSSIKSFTEVFLAYLNSLIVPLGVILGLVLGYPLLKKKLIEGYVIDQLKIMHDNNREVRKECVRLKEKYQRIKVERPDLTIEQLDEIIDDFQSIRELSIEANQDTYKYCRLVLDSLVCFKESVKHKIPYTLEENYNSQDLFCFAYYHLDIIYKYARSIGYIANNYIIEKKHIFSSRLDKFVSEGAIYQVKSIDESLDHRHSSEMLVVFHGINNKCLGYKNGTLLRCCYFAAPSPSPFARILFLKGIYFPLVLIKPGNHFLFTKKLCLIGFTEQTSTVIGTNEKRKKIICHYTDTSEIRSQVENSGDLNKFTDGYLRDNSFDFSIVDDFNTYGDNVVFEISREIAIQHFKKNERKLRRRLRKEL